MKQVCAEGRRRFIQAKAVEQVRETDGSITIWWTLFFPEVRDSQQS